VDASPSSDPAHPLTGTRRRSAARLVVWTLIGLSAAVALIVTRAQRGQARQTPDPQALIPFDAAVRTGALGNERRHYTSKPITREQVASLDRARMLAFYKALFSNAADFTLFMAGAFQVDQAVPLLARYVGTLPSTGRRTSQVRDVGLRFPDGMERAGRSGREPRSHAVISFFADPPPEPAEQQRVVAATDVLEIGLRDILREQLGQTYSVSVILASRATARCRLHRRGLRREPGECRRDDRGCPRGTGAAAAERADARSDDPRQGGSPARPRNRDAAERLLDEEPAGRALPRIRPRRAARAIAANRRGDAGRA
jgi:Peptidase M16 inactive domain